MRRRLGRVKVVVVREEGNKARKGSKGDWLPLSFKISRQKWVEEKRSPEPTTHPSVKGKGQGKQQEGSGLDAIRPYPDSQVVLRTGPESQKGRVKYRAGRDTKVIMGLKSFKTTGE